MLLQCFPSNFCSIQLTVWEMSFEELQYGCHGSHLGYENGTILAILNLYVASHQVLAQSDLRFGRRCHLKNFKMAPWRLSWLLERNDFSNSESLCPCDASHQVLAQSKLSFGRRCRLKNFKMATMAAILDTRTKLF